MRMQLPRSLVLVLALCAATWVHAAERVSEDWRAGLVRALEFIAWTQTNWLGTVLEYDKPRSWNGTWPTTVQAFEGSAVQTYEGLLPPPFGPINKSWLGRERGGRLDQHIERWKALAASGEDVEIRGSCYSACTLVLARWKPNTAV